MYFPKMDRKIHPFPFPFLLIDSIHHHAELMPLHAMDVNPQVDSLTSNSIGSIMNFILWVVLSGASPVLVMDHAE